MKERRIRVIKFFKWSILKKEHLEHIRKDNKRLRKVVLTGELNGLEDFDVEQLEMLKKNLLNDVSNIDEVIKEKS